MCDFHSIAVRRDGAIAHIPGNSHSGAVEAAGWRENGTGASQFREPFFVEAEWSGEGEFPGVDRITRNASTMNEKQRQKISDHYKALAKLLADPAEHAERMCLGRGIFAAPEYSDIRWKIFVDARTPEDVVAKLALTSLYAAGCTITTLHPAVTKIEGNFRVEAKATLTAPVLAQTGDVVLDQGATLTAPVLAQTGYVRLYQGASFTAPVLGIQDGTKFTKHSN